MGGRHPETDPCAALAAWREASGIVEGPLFTSIHVSGKLGGGLCRHRRDRIIVGAAKAAGIDATGYPGRSLRAGLATSALPEGRASGAFRPSPADMSTTMLRRYIRSGSLFAETVATLDL